MKRIAIFFLMLNLTVAGLLAAGVVEGHLTWPVFIALEFAQVLGALQVAMYQVMADSYWR